ncbi:MAG TPA: lysophospholipid acyltransferase family protein [Dehalococcoidia bacterium]|nr:lysophospholipid acyltransferase family protein [Dehalococcoidia bacterium]
MIPAFYNTCNVLARGLAATLADVDVAGLHHVPKHGPVILVSNHLNNVDPILLAAFLPRPIHFLTKVELTSLPLVGTLARWYGAVPVRRGELDRRAIDRTIELLRAGEVVGVFPEGTRSRSGALKEPKPGLSLLAARSGAPLLPVAVWGSEKARGISIVWEHPRIHVRVGEPFVLPIRRRREGHRDFTDQVMTHIARLLPPDYRGIYRDHPKVNGNHNDTKDTKNVLRN